ncbi:hypothetical protein PFISCL1PPCAC_20899, partial [Pristionchus fissidentatus]
NPLRSTKKTCITYDGSRIFIVDDLAATGWELKKNSLSQFAGISEAIGEYFDTSVTEQQKLVELHSRYNNDRESMSTNEAALFRTLLENQRDCVYAAVVYPKADVSDRG